MTEHIPSISGLAQIMLGSGIIGVALGYAWWSSIRITFFRQDLFEIRDNLWDRGRELGALGDPRYQNMREVLNSCISAASFISLPQLVRAQLVHGASSPGIVESQRPEVEEIISNAESQLVSRVSRFMLWDRPVSGIFFWAVLVVASLAFLAPRAFIRDLVRAWASTIGPHELSLIAKQTNRAAHIA